VLLWCEHFILLFNLFLKSWHHDVFFENVQLIKYTGPDGLQQISDDSLFTTGKIYGHPADADFVFLVQHPIFSYKTR